MNRPARADPSDADAAGATLAGGTGVPPPRLLRAVSAALPALARLPWQPLAGGRVNRLWRAGDAVVKLYTPGAATALFANDPAAEAAALAAAAPAGLAPRLLARGAGWLAYAHVEGTPWRADPRLAARALAAVHALPAAGFAPRPGGSAAFLAQAAAMAPGLAAPPDPGIGPPARACPIHGDAVPGNLIVGGGGAVWVDWQCPALADPAEDLATFLSPAMQWLYRGAPLAAEEAAAFLAACPERATVVRYHALAAVLHHRIAAHCAWRAARGAPGYGDALRLETAACAALA